MQHYSFLLTLLVATAHADNTSNTILTSLAQWTDAMSHHSCENVGIEKVKPVRVGDLTEEEELALIQKEAAKNIDSRKSRFEQFYKKMTTKKHTFHFAKETPVFLIVFCVALNVFLICLACIFFHTGIESHETQLDVTEVTGEDCFSEGEEYDMSEITNTPVEVTESVSVVEAEQEGVQTDSAPVESDPMTSMPESEC